MASEILTPLQVDVMVPVECEVTVHAVNRVQKILNISQEKKCILLLDYSNDISSICHQKMFVEVRSHIPLMAAW